MKNEEIIIDVTKCQYYNKNGKCRIPHFENDIKYVSCNCCEWDCYFKQNEKYIKIFNNIKKYTLENFCENCEDRQCTEYSSHCEFCEYQEYLNILNEMKDNK